MSALKSDAKKEYYSVEKKLSDLQENHKNKADKLEVEGLLGLIKIFDAFNHKDNFRHYVHCTKGWSVNSIIPLFYAHLRDI